VKLQVASVAKSFTIDMWLARHTPEKVLPILQKVISSVKEEFADSVASGGGIYAIGYCFGARYVLLLGSDLDKEAAAGQRNPESAAEEGMVRQGAQIKAGAIAHGTQIGKEELEAVTVPLCIVAVENDNLFPDNVRDEGKTALEAKKLEHEMKVYPGVPHGFAVYGDYEDDKIKKAQEEAHQQILGWLKSH
jgi:dienelactone hydrolase